MSVVIKSELSIIIILLWGTWNMVILDLVPLEGAIHNVPHWPGWVNHNNYNCDLSSTLNFLAL